MTSVDLIYPTAPAARTEWIKRQRPPRNAVDANRPYAYLVEEECSAAGEVVPVATVFLTNRECPWRCTMCDLWKNTLTETLKPGAIPQQIRFALDRLGPARHVKLYNSGSFFDGQAIPVEDYGAIAQATSGFERVIVECHPALIGRRCLSFRGLLKGRLEIAMGLETAHPVVLEKLNKGVTLERFARAAELLRREGIALRVFVLVQPPFLRAEHALEWAQRSVDLAFDCGATAVSLIPTRGGNGAMEVLARSGEFTPPTLAMLEASAEYGLNQRRGRVFADLWDLRSAPRRCEECWPLRIDRLQRMNLSQSLEPRVECGRCGGLS